MGAQDRARGAHNSVADDSARHRSAGDSVRPAGNAARQPLQAAPQHVEPLEIRNVGRNRLARDAYDQDRLLVRDDHSADDNAFGAYCGDDVDRSAGIANRA